MEAANYSIVTSALKGNSQLGRIVIRSDFRADILKMRLYLFHIEKGEADIPFPRVKKEVIWIVGFQTIERVDRASQTFTVFRTADPAFPRKFQHPVITKQTTSLGDTDKQFVYQDAELYTKPLGKAHGYAIVCTPGPIFSRLSALNNQYRFITAILSKSGIPDLDKMAVMNLYWLLRADSREKMGPGVQTIA